jgi:hypothetical protein
MPRGVRPDGARTFDRDLRPYSSVSERAEASGTTIEGGTMRYLRRIDDGALFAYTREGHFFYRAADGELWAYETANYLYSARSGRALAYRVGTEYRDADRHVPLYAEAYRAAISA